MQAPVHPLLLLLPLQLIYYLSHPLTYSNSIFQILAFISGLELIYMSGFVFLYGKSFNGSVAAMATDEQSLLTAGSNCSYLGFVSIFRKGPI